MKFQELKVDKLHHQYSIIVSPEEYETRLNERLAEMGRTAKIAGFRPGKIPLSILKQRYEPTVRTQVIERVVELALEKLYKDNNLKPAFKPEINFQSVDTAKEIEFTIAFDVLPTLDPLKLTDIKLERLTAEMPPTKVDEAYKNLKERNRILNSYPPSHKAQRGDVVVINFTGKCEGNLIPKGSGKNIPLELGSASFIDTFEDQLIGKEAGDHVTVNVTFPTTYHEKKLAGKPAEFEVDILDIQKYIDPELDDTFAKKLGFDNVDDLDKALKQQLQAECDRMSFLVAKRQLLDQLAENKFDVPQKLLDIEFDTIWKHYLDLQKTNANNNTQGTLTDQTQQQDSDKDQEQYRQLAERRVRLGLLLADIGRRYEVTVTNKELETALLATVRRYPGQEKQVYEYFKNNRDAIATLRAPIFEDKVIKLILDKATITPKTVSYEHLEKAVKDVTEGEEDTVSSA